MKVLTSVQMKEAERLTAETAGISTLRLMESAGVAAARIVSRELGMKKRRCAVVCGKGGNGGDGIVAALWLKDAGYDVSVILSHGKPTHTDALDVYSRLQDAGIKAVDWSYDAPVCAAIFRHCSISAASGISASRHNLRVLSEAYAALFRKIPPYLYSRLPKRRCTPAGTRIPIPKAASISARYLHKRGRYLYPRGENTDER